MEQKDEVVAALAAAKAAAEAAADAAARSDDEILRILEIAGHMVKQLAVTAVPRTDARKLLGEWYRDGLIDNENLANAQRILGDLDRTGKDVVDGIFIAETIEDVRKNLDAAKVATAAQDPGRCDQEIWYVIGQSKLAIEDLKTSKDPRVDVMKLVNKWYSQGLITTYSVTNSRRILRNPERDERSVLREVGVARTPDDVRENLARRLVVEAPVGCQLGDVISSKYTPNETPATKTHI